MQVIPKKELGQNFLFNKEILATIASYAELTKADHVLEIGPGLGTLTSQLCMQAGMVTALELDSELARKLPHNVAELMGRDISTITNLTVAKQDALTYDLDNLPENYKVVANIPYNITSKIISKLWSAGNKPAIAVLLVQKEVAERLAAEPGQLSVLAIATQIFAEVSLGVVVPASEFIPAPKVDSQVVIMRRRSVPLVNKVDQAAFFQVVRAGFTEKRKKLRSSLAVGLRTNKAEADRLLLASGIDPNKRAQELTIADWKRLAKCD